MAVFVIVSSRVMQEKKCGGTSLYAYGCRTRVHQTKFGILLVLLVTKYRNGLVMHATVTLFPLVL